MMGDVAEGYNALVEKGIKAKSEDEQHHPGCKYQAGGK